MDRSKESHSGIRSPSSIDRSAFVLRIYRITVSMYCKHVRFSSKVLSGKANPKKFTQIGLNEAVFADIHGASQCPETRKGRAE